MNNISLIILAGGKASRLNGKDKFDIMFQNERIIDRQLRILNKLFTNVYVISNKPINNIPCIVYSDIYTNVGPLGGIHAALHYAETNYVFIISVDMPFVEPEIISLMINECKKYQHHVVVPTHQYGIEPLFAIYSKNVKSVIEKQINQKKYAVRDFFDKVKILYWQLPEKYCSKKVFFNINYPDDIQKAYLYET